VVVTHDLARLVAGLGEAESVHDVVQTALEQITQQVLARDALLAVASS
jgi:hypothetical protein